MDQPPDGADEMTPVIIMHVEIGEHSRRFLVALGDAKIEHWSCRVEDDDPRNMPVEPHAREGWLTVRVRIRDISAAETAIRRASLGWMNR